MPDGALKQFAEMHKEDPYSFSLAIAESNRRKQIRSQVPPMQEQPKVADQEISSMTRPPEEVGIGALPVDMNMASGGIIAFDQGGYVPSYSGKKDSAVDVKKVFVDEYGPVAKTVGKELGVDPSILLAQWGMESRWGSSTVGDFNVGNIKDFSGKGKKGFDKAEKSNDAYREYESAEAFGKDYVNLMQRNFPKAIGSGSDLDAFTSGLQNGRLGAYATDKNYGKTLAKTLTSLVPISSAQAETAQPATTSDVDRRSVSGQVKSIGQGLERLKNRFMTGSSEPQAAPQQVAGNETDSSSRIPSYTPPAGYVGRPAEDDRSIFARAGDALLIPRSVQDDIYKLTAPLSGSVGAAPRLLKAAPSAAKAFEKALEATPEAVAAAAAAAQKVASPRLTLAKPVAQGIEGLTPEAQALRAAAEKAKLARENTRNAANLNADYNAARTTRDAVVEANAVAKGLGLEATAVDAAKAAQVAKANKIINVGRTASGLETIPGGIDDRFFGGKDGNKAPKETPEQKAATEKSNASMQAIQEAEDADILATRRAAMKAEDLSKTEKKDVIALAKENAPDSARTKGFNNDDWLQFGLSLMAGTSRYALQNVGTAGMAALAGKKEREKEERAIAAKVLDKTDMTKVIDRLMKDDPKLSYREAYEIFQQGKTNADLIARGLEIKGGAAQTDRATKIATRKAELDKLYPSFLRNSDSPTGKKMAAEYAAQIAALEKEYPPIAGGTVPAAPAATMPLPGAKIVGSRPA